jgi:hypothetical protein
MLFIRTNQKKGKLTNHLHNKLKDPSISNSQMPFLPCLKLLFQLIAVVLVLYRLQHFLLIILHFLQYFLYPPLLFLVFLSLDFVFHSKAFVHLLLSLMLLFISVNLLNISFVLEFYLIFFTLSIFLLTFFF